MYDDNVIDQRMEELTRSMTVLGGAGGGVAALSWFGLDIWRWWFERSSGVTVSVTVSVTTCTTLREGWHYYYCSNFNKTKGLVWWLIKEKGLVWLIWEYEYGSWVQLHFFIPQPLQMWLTLIHVPSEQHSLVP